ncbi:hypothetical protein [uncultured Chryseobacterium sp.]|uniref:hypothetical protein n=1 Tax=uncultured Chryseobacterium sp. TaxID=259322 RepID=UPI0025CC55FC|nr:hypothetical protein [uncultured Chryseobacterium sp.]
MQYKIPFHFDLETADPDDAMTSAILATHPRVYLVSVSVHPGGKDQIGFVRKILNILDREDIRIGAPVLPNLMLRVYPCFTGIGSEDLKIRKRMVPQ